MMVGTPRTPSRLLDVGGSVIAKIGPLLPNARVSTLTDVRTRAFRDGSPLETDRSRTKTLPASLPPAHPQADRSIIQEERDWRRPDFLLEGARADPSIVATRWVGTDLRERTSEITSDYHMLSLSLQPTEFSIWLGTKAIPHKKLLPGMMQLTAPAVPARIVYYAAYDVLHLFIPNALLREVFKWTHGKSPIGDVALRDPSYAQDAVIGSLGAALLAANELDGRHGALYADSLSLAIVARLLSLYAEKRAATSHRQVAALPNWRLKRVMDFMDANSEKQIRLADLARIAELSRMHFAAQFRKATGQRPHEYLLQRRVDKAKVMLATGGQSIADVALTVGFSSQSHFTGVFKRLTNLTPRRWRESSSV